LVTGLAWSQRPTQAPPAAPAAPATREHLITVEETGKPAQKCRLLKYWRQASGYKGYQVQAVDTGEILTILESGPPSSAGTPNGGQFKAVATQIYRWGNGPNPPPGTPMPPADAVVLAAPQSSSWPVVAPTPLRLQPTPTGSTQPAPSPQIVKGAPAAPSPPASGPQIVQATPTPLRLQSVPNTPTQTASGPQVIQGTPTGTVSGPQVVQAKPTQAASGPQIVQATPSQPSSGPQIIQAAPTQVQEQPGRNPSQASTTNNVTPAQATTPVPNRLVPMPMPAGPQTPNQGSPSAVTISTPNQAPPGPSATTSTTCGPCSTCPPCSGAPVVLLQKSNGDPLFPRLSALVHRNYSTACPDCSKPDVPPSGPVVITSGTPNCTTCPSPVVKQPDCAPLSAPRQPLLTRIFSPEDSSARAWGKPSCDGKMDAAVVAPNTEANPKPAPPVVSATTSKPKPTDWRESWGKADMATGTPPVVPEKKTISETARPQPKPPTATASAADPLRNPSLYSRVVSAPKKDPAVKDGPLSVPPMPGGMKPGMGSVLATRSSELGKGGIGIDASEGNAFSDPAPPKPKKADPIAMNAFSMMQPDSASAGPSQPGMAAGMPPVPMMPATPRFLPPADGGTPAGLKNAFTDGGNARPIPADFGSQGMPINAFVDHSAEGMPFQPEGMPAMPRMPMPPSMPMPRPMQAMGTPQMSGALAMAPQGAPFPPMMAQQPMPAQPATMPGPMPQPAPPVPAAMPQRPAASLQLGNAALNINEQADVPQLRTMLKEALFPSHREWAADRLGGFDWRTHPEVVQSLVTTAKDDPAPMVRAGCVRSLAKMKVNTVDVVAVLEQMEKDSDPRVRTEVQQCLALVKPGYVIPQESEVRQASGLTAPAGKP
jgi:hypothetical protein